nr:unnamed protein product [Callosobruchus chinensis]
MSTPSVPHFANFTSGSSHLGIVLLVNPFDLIYRCPAVVLSIAIFLSSLTPSHNARLDPDETWWLNPCSKQTQYRYGRSAAENQLRTFIDRIDTRFFKELRELYEQVPTSHSQRFLRYLYK